MPLMSCQSCDEVVYQGNVNYSCSMLGIFGGNYLVGILKDSNCVKNQKPFRDCSGLMQ